MKKYLLLILIACVFVFTACSDDDDKGPENNDPIVGTWAVVDITPPTININECEQTSTITFNSNNTGNATFYLAETACIPASTTGTWENLGNNVYRIFVPVTGDLQGEIDFNGANEFFFVTDTGITITFQKE